MAAVLGLGFNYAAYEAENYRAGLYFLVGLPLVCMARRVERAMHPERHA